MIASRGLELEGLEEGLEVGLDAGRLHAGAARAVCDYLDLLLHRRRVVVLVLAVEGYLWRGRRRDLRIGTIGFYRIKR